MRVSAVISTYNRAQFLPGLFDSIKNQTLPASEFDVIFINNNSTDETGMLLKEFVDNRSGIKVFYYEEPNQGLSYCRNRGIRESHYDLVTFLDDDALPAPDFLEKTVSFFDKHPEAGAAGGKILLHFEAIKPDWYNPFLSPLLGYFNPGDKTKPFKHTYFRGSNMTFRRSLFNMHEPFDTKLGRTGDLLLGGEEKELFYRLKNNGVQLWYNADAVVYHLVPAERTTQVFIKTQALGTGSSKKVQAQIEGNYSLFKAYLAEVFKWGASVAISLSYFMTFRYSKGIMIIKFRCWVSRALFMS